MEKSLGQIAYEAYAEHVGGLTYDGKPMPAWDEESVREEFYKSFTLSDKTRRAWDASAYAVAEELES
jgi:hypothetical protein